jgi:hypothetical protein
MMTVRQIEKRWDARQYQRLLDELVAARPEAVAMTRLDGGVAVAAAALAVVRLSELNQSAAPISSQHLRTILAAQEADGGWGEPLLSAMCLRALLLDAGAGAAVDAAIAYFANLQQSDGAWPRIPIRRMPADAFVTAFILFHLADHAQFRDAVNIPAAMAWMTRQEPQFDDDTRHLWLHARLRARLSTRPAGVCAASIC